jgi:hypothetical protein
MNLIFLFVTILGLILFLYGSAFYAAIVGWVGVYFMFGGVISYLIHYIYNGIFAKE